MGVAHHVGTIASVDTFFEGQERVATSRILICFDGMSTSSGSTGDFACSTVEMEAGTLFKMGAVYGFAVECVYGIVADRQSAEAPDLAIKDSAVNAAIKVAVRGADGRATSGARDAHEHLSELAL